MKHRKHQEISSSDDDHDDKIKASLWEVKKGVKSTSKGHRHRPHHSKPLLRNQYPVPLFDSICLVISSMFFLIPGLQAFHCGMKWYGVLSFVTSAVSMNYWYLAVPGWRRNLDLFMAKFSFIIYFITGALYVTDSMLLVVGWPLCVCILISYWMSSQRWQRDCWTWVLCHMSFHFFVAIEQAIVITGSFDECSMMKDEIHRNMNIFKDTFLKS